MLIDQVGNNVPSDWESPDWDSCGRVHEWKNYVDDEVRELWHGFTTDQKQALAQNYEGIAGREEWD